VTGRMTAMRDNRETPGLDEGWPAREGDRVRTDRKREVRPALSPVYTLRILLFRGESSAAIRHWASGVISNL